MYRRQGLGKVYCKPYRPIRKPRFYRREVIRCKFEFKHTHIRRGPVDMDKVEREYLEEPLFVD